MVRHEYLQYVLFRTSRVAALNSIISVYLCRKWIIGRSFFRPVDGQVHFRWRRGVFKLAFLPETAVTLFSFIISFTNV